MLFVYMLTTVLLSQALPNRHDDIEGLRIIRDPSTLVGKGIGYLLFKDRDCVHKALALHKVRLFMCVCIYTLHIYTYIYICALFY
jgi:hypothetical protein